MHDLRISLDAQADLNEIQDYGLAKFGLVAARSHMAGFEQIFTMLRRHPMTGQLRPEYGYGVRSFSHRPHRVFYRIEGGAIEIARILHGSRDAARILQ